MRTVKSLAGAAFVGGLVGLCHVGCAPAPAETEDGDVRLGVTAQALTSCVSIQRGMRASAADASLSRSSMKKNLGLEPSLKVDRKNETLLWFDLSGIPSSAVVSSATLKLQVQGDGACDHDDDDDDDEHDGHSAQWHHAQGHHDAATVRIHRATQAWSEGTVTFASFGQHFDPSIAGLLQTSSPSARKSADVTTLVSSWVRGAQPNAGFLLDTTSKRKTVFVSSESSTVALRPALEVCFTTRTDFCASNPCANGGACQNGESGYTCACPPGFSGARCETNINECAGNPCKNGAACTDGVDRYTCECPAGFSGPNCETNIDECALAPCRNGGVCTDGVARFTCACPPGFAGAACETNIDECAGAPCKNGGACSDGAYGYVCACAPGFTGANCETNIDECVGAPCQNGGTCVDGVGLYTCACAPGFEGVNCESNIDECAGAPCQNGGSCRDGVFGYSCSCAPGYTGVNCQVDVDDCASQPCQNGGTCIDGVASYTCRCAPGFEGPNCSDVVLDGSTAARAAASCNDILRRGFSRGDGRYWVAPNGGAPLEVTCDMTGEDGGWTLLGRGHYWVGVDETLTAPDGRLPPAQMSALIASSGSLFRIGRSQKLFIHDPRAVFETIHYWKTTGAALECANSYPSVRAGTMAPVTWGGMSCDPLGVGTHTCGFGNGWILYHAGDTYDVSGQHPCPLGSGAAPTNGTVLDLYVR